MLITSLTTSNAEIAPKSYAPYGFRRRNGICCVGASRRCTTSPASHRLASAPAALGTWPIVLLPRAVRGRGTEAKAFADQMLSLKGIKHAKPVLANTGAEG
jgi:hypothetical protein